MYALGICVFCIISARIALNFSDEISSQVLQRFRILFPSWRFFGEADSFTLLEYQTRDSDLVSQWISFPPQEKRSISMLLFNPSGNLALAIQSLIEQCAATCYQNPRTIHDTLPHTNSYKILNSVLQQHLNTSQQSIDFRWRLLLQTSYGDVQEIYQTSFDSRS